MRLLIIGGTRFAGRHLVEAALARHHTLTLFNRGQSNPELFPQVEQLHGDRTEDLALLQDRSWDAVIDTSGYVPRHVRSIGGSAGRPNRSLCFHLDGFRLRRRQSARHG